MHFHDHHPDSTSLSDHERSVFDHEIEQLKSWPHTIHTIDETLDPELIEHRARQLLFQALNRRSLVAFVGSGVPMAYGRLSWAQWLKHQLESISDVADAFLKCCKISLKYLTAQIEDLERPGGGYLQEELIRLRDDAAIDEGNKKEINNNMLTSVLKSHLSVKNYEIEFCQKEIEQLKSTFDNIRKKKFSDKESAITFEIATKLREMLLRNAEVFIRHQSEKCGDLSTDGCSISLSRIEYSIDQAKIFGYNPDCDNSRRTILKKLNTQYPDSIWKSIHPDAMKDFATALNRFSEAIHNPSAMHTVEHVAKLLLVDECAHAEEILRRSIERDRKSGRPVPKRDKDKDKEELSERELGARNLLRDHGSTNRPDNLLRNIKGIRQDPFRYWALGFFKTASILALNGEVRRQSANGCGWQSVFNLLENQLQQNMGQSSRQRHTVDRTFVSPSHRFVVEMLLALLDNPICSRAWPVTKDEITKPNSDDPGPSIYSPVHQDDLRSRLSIIDEPLDPLDKMVIGLRIRQFLTTNYDFEIERYFQDRDYETLPSDNGADRGTSGGEVRRKQPDDYRVDGLGGILRDQTFERTSASNLIGFAVNPEAADASVFHLHGRATQDGRLVITERDYMDLYLRHDRYRDTVDESIRVAFSANTLLFVGLGMNESDVLRPLREFMSNNDSTRGRTAIVLSPAIGDRASRAQDAALRYVRFGTHTVHFGDAWVNHDGTMRRIDWLHHVFTLLDALKEINESIRDALVNQETPSRFANADPSSIFSFLKERLETGPIAAEAPHPFDLLFRARDEAAGADPPPSNVPSSPITVNMYIRDVGNRSSRPAEAWPELKWCSFRLRKPEQRWLPQDPKADQRPIIDRYYPYIGFEAEMVGLLTGLTITSTAINRATLQSLKSRQQKIKKRQSLDGGSETLTRKARNDADAKHRAHSKRLTTLIEKEMLAAERYELPLIRDLNARLIAIEGVKNSLLTATLCICLDELERDRDDWWQHWQLMPPERVPQFDQVRVGRPEDRTEPDIIYDPRRFTRHRVEQVISPVAEPAATDGIGWRGSDPPKTGPTAAGSQPSPGERRKADATGSRDPDPSKSGIPKTSILSFDTFTAAVASRLRQDRRFIGKGRRLHVVAAARGLGKGSFMSAFASTLGLRAYIKANWPGGGTTQWPLYLGAIFVNLSFATEIASTYEMLVRAVADLTAETRMLNQLSKDRRHPASARDGTTEDKAPSVDEATQIEKEADQIRGSLNRLSRIRRIKQAFAMFAQASADRPKPVWYRRYAPQPRLIICLNAVDLLHFRRGIVKNREIEEVLVFLTGDKSAGYPIDVVLIGGETAISEVLAQKTPFVAEYNQAKGAETAAINNGGSGLLFVPTVRGDITPRGIQNVNRRMEQSYLPFDGMRILQRDDKEMGVITPDLARAPAPGAGGQWTTDTICYVHFIRAVRPESILIDNFPRLALILYAGYALGRVSAAVRESIASDEVEDYKSRQEALVSVGHQSLLEPLNHWTIDFSKPITGGTPSRNEFWRTRRQQIEENCYGIFQIIFARFLKETHPSLDQLSKILKSDFDNENPYELTTDHMVAIKQLAEGNTERWNELPIHSRTAIMKSVFLQRYDLEAKDAKEEPSGHEDTRKAYVEWREIRHALRGNRYCLTIVLAAAEHLALSGRTMIEGRDLAQKFIRSTIDHVKSVSAGRREEAVLSNVLDVYDAFHCAGDPVNDVKLHLLILRHLSVMGCPCSPDVLVRVPEIRRYFQGVFTENEVPREHRVRQALTALVARGLVFELVPHPRIADRFQHLTNKYIQKIQEIQQQNLYRKPPDEDIRELINEDAQYKDDVFRIFGRNAPDRQYRYALHRLMQRHIMRKMGSGPRDPSQMNGFAPSLSASMPSDLPRLNVEAYGFLTRLVANLSQYPDHKSDLPGAENWHFGTASLTTQVQALRAALSVVRSTFSIAVVSRFEDYVSVEARADTPRRGYFEEYAVQIRWLIRKAFNLLEGRQADPRQYRSDREDRPSISAFYIDEIVWLYNECGVVNLVQGNLAGAVTLIRQAIAINRRIEGEIDDGPMHNRLSLNLAVVQIERGRLDAARERLAQICASETIHSRRKGRVWHIAHGYLGLIHHLLGDLETAKKHYREALDILRVYEDNRACAVFSRHLGDLLRGQRQFAEASRSLDDALSFAQAGGHEDVHMRTRLSRIRLEASQAKHEQGSARSDMRAVTAALQVVKDYAQSMEIPALTCEADLIRADMLIDYGETTLAGQLLSRTITVAKRNDMYLRLNAALTRYAHVLALRDLKDQANRMLFTSLEMAKRSRNQLEIRSVEDVFDVLHGL